MIYLIEGDVRLPLLSEQGPPDISKKRKPLKVQSAALGAVGLTQMVKYHPPKKACNKEGSENTSSLVRENGMNT